jgi:hypothetical protein
LFFPDVGVGFLEEAHQIRDLTQALLDIRDAAKELHNWDWPAAKGLSYTIEDRLEVGTHPYDMHVLFQSLKAEVHRACLSWLAVYREVENHQSRAAPQKAVLAGAEKLVRRIDTLLAAMQLPRPR